MRNSKSPSIHSIYQNALPFYHDRADLINVDVREAAFAREFLNGLLNGNFTSQIDTDSLSTEKLRHIFFESKNYEKTAGPKTFGVGYPLLIDSFEGNLFVAPLFVWQLSLEPAQTKVDSWIVKFSPENRLFPNHQLVNYLKRKFDLDWQEKLIEVTSAKQLNENSLKQICEELVERLQLDEATNEGSIVSTPGIDKIGGLTEKGCLHWSAVLGLYPPQNEFSTDFENKPEDVFISEKIEQETPKMVFPFIPSDPEQVTAIELVERNTMAVVEGVDALGKTQTVFNVLLNALANGEKCLVVSERSQALKKTQALLAKTGVNQFHFLLDDALNDKLPILELLKVMADGTELQGVFNEKEYEKKKNDFIEISTKLDGAYGAVKKKIFGKSNWTDVVGLYLESQHIEGKELLAGDLQVSDFAFEQSEHDRLIEVIERCKPSFAQVGTLSHPLTALHHRFFGGVEANEELEKVQSLLVQYLEKGKEIQRRYLNGVDAYAAKLKKYYSEESRKLEKEAVSISNKIGAYSNQLGDNFQKAGGGGLNLGLLFSSKKKKVAKAQKELAKDFAKLTEMHEENRFFEFERAPDNNGKHVAKLIENINRYLDGLSRWKERVGTLVQEEANRLNSKTAHPALDVKEQITELEYSLELFIEELNESGLFQNLFENKTLTVPQRQKYLESILEKLESTQLNLRDFPVFHQWQTNWVALNPLEKKVVQTLIKVKPNDWNAAFQSWYFYNLLSLVESPELPLNEELVYEYNEKWHSFKPLIIKRIQYYWKSEQQSSLKSFKRKNKKAFRRLFGKTGADEFNRLTLRQFFSDSFETVSNFLPLLFVTPHVALNVIPENFVYDLIVFEESNRFSVEMATALAGRGKRVAIFGSDDNNGNETSLLQYALESNIPSAKITNAYEAPSIKSLVVEGANPLFHFAQEYSVEALEGRFHEMESTNDTEAQYIIRLLNQIKQTPQRVYPTVGIVTFTVEQRDLISSYLLKLKQQNSAGSEKIKQLERNGLGVYSSEEAYGQQFDILILSCTYGAVNLKGELTKKLMFLNTPEGQSHLHLFINKPVQKLFIVHSFSEEMLESFLAKKYDEGTWLLSNFIQLAEATTNGNQFLKEESLQALGKKEQRSRDVSPFSIQVKKMLAPYFDENRFALSGQQGDVLIPLTIDPEKESQKFKLALFNDVFLADTENTSGIWEHHRMEGLKAIGLKYIPVSSLAWFRNSDLEARKLASQIIKLDNLHAVKKKPDEGIVGSKFDTEDEKISDDI